MEAPRETPRSELGVLSRSSHAWGRGWGEPGGSPAWSPRRMRGVPGGRRGLVGRKHGFPCSRNDIASDVVGAAGIDAAGKRTQSELLRARAERGGLTVATLAFPRYGETVYAETIAAYLAGDF